MLTWFRRSVAFHFNTQQILEHIKDAVARKHKNHVVRVKKGVTRGDNLPEVRADNNSRTLLPSMNVQCTVKAGKYWVEMLIITNVVHLLNLD